MEDENAWNSIEGAIKSLSSKLQSFPDELKERALKLLGTQLNNSTDQLFEAPSNEKEIALTLENGEVALNGDAADTTETNTSSVSTSKRLRGRRPKVKSVDAAKDSSTGVKNGLRVGTKQKTNLIDEGSSAKNITRSSRKETKETKKMERSIYECPAVEKPTRRDRSKRSTATPLKSADDNDSSMPKIEMPDKKDVDKKDLESEMVNKLGPVTDSTSDVPSAAPKGRKRGRPRKSDLELPDLKNEESSGNEVGMTDVKESVPPKKPGRPRQSSYSPGYVPRAKNFHCMECGKMLATKQSFREHQRQHTGEGFICDCCGQKFTTSSGFMLHKRYHMDDPHMFKCSKCKYIVSSQQLLDDHYQLRHDPNRPKSHVCDVCGKGFHGSTQLEKHLFSHSNTKPYACDQCSFSTAYPGGLEKHKYNVHVADRTLYRCELCGIQLKSKGTYIEHIGRHFNQRKKKCDTCNKTFPNASQLAAHRRCHLEPMVPCSVCGKKLRSKHKLKVHELIHTGQKDFKCPYCSYVTYVKHNLKKHCLARHKVDYPPLLTQKMKKYKLSEVSSEGFKDPLALKCIRKLNNSMESSTEEKSGVELIFPDSDAIVVAPATTPPPTTTATTTVAENVPEKSEFSASNVQLVPMTKFEMIAAAEPKAFVGEEKMYVTLSTIDRSAILDFHCPPGTTFYPTSLYLPTLVSSDQQMS